MKSETFYYFSHVEWAVIGPYESEEAARADAQASEPHTATVSILREVSTSAPPSLQRKWKAA